MLKRPVNDYAPERELVMGLLHGNSLHDFLGIHQCQHVTPRMPATLHIGIVTLENWVGIGI